MFCGVTSKTRCNKGLLAGLCFGLLYGFIELLFILICYLDIKLLHGFCLFWVISNSWVFLIVTLFVENAVVALISCVFVHFAIGFIIGKQIHRRSEKSFHIKIFLYSWISYIVAFPVIRISGSILTVLLQTIIDPGGWWA